MAANPKRAKLTLTQCIVAAPSANGNLRFLVSAETNTFDLEKLTGFASASVRTPYRLWPADDTGIRGEFWAKPRESFRDYWLQEAGRLRGRPVDVEVAPRKYCFVASNSEKLVGWTLDLLDAKERA
jgi:hypothetical protein